MINAELGNGNLDLSGGHAARFHGLLESLRGQASEEMLKSSVRLIQVGRQQDDHRNLVALVGEFQEVGAQVLRDSCSKLGFRHIS
jgi:hypothetical protein